MREDSNQSAAPQGFACDASDLCREITIDPQDSEYRQTYGAEIRSRIVARHGTVVAMVDLAPLVVGHLLILPIDHYSSMLAAPREVQQDAINLLCAVSKVIGVLGDVQVVEHGSGTGDDTQRSCITHAHWHVLPAAPDVRTLFVAQGLSPTRFASLARLHELAPIVRSYFLVARAIDDVAVFLDPGPTPAQLLRQSVARELGAPAGQYDWAVHQDREAFRRTLEMFDV